MRNLFIFVVSRPIIERLAYPILFLFVGLAAWSAYARPFGHDEFEAIHTAWKMWSGERIYVDFFQHHHALYYPILGWLLGIFGPTTDMVLAARGLSFVMVLAMVFFAYRLARQGSSRETAIIAVLLLSTTFLFIDKGIEVRPDVPQAFTGLIAVYCWFRYDITKQRRFLLLMAGFLFLSFLFLQKAVFLIALLGGYTLYRVIKQTLPMKDLFLLWGVWSLLLASFGAYLWVTGVWSEYLFLNWTVNTRLMNTFSPLKYLWFSMIENPLLWLAFFSSSAWLIWRRVWSLAGLLAVGLIGTALLTRTPFAQYYLLAMPFVAIVAAEGLSALMQVWRVWPVLIVVGLSAVYPAVRIVDEIGKTNADQLAKVNYVLSLTGPDDFVYDGDAEFNLFRKDMDYFWFSVRPEKGVLSAYQSFRPYVYDPYQLIVERQPKLISNSFIKVEKSALNDQYARSSVYKDLYLRK